MSSFTIDIDNLLADSLNLTTTRFINRSPGYEARDHKSRLKDNYLKGRIQSAMKIVS